MFFKKNSLKFHQILFQTCTSQFQEGLLLYWRQKVVQHRINKEMYTVSVVFPLFPPHIRTTAMSLYFGITDGKVKKEKSRFPLLN
jgi:hypothetical protein